MDIYLLITSIVTLGILGIIAFKFIKKKLDFKRTLNLAFLKITLPKKDSDLDSKKETAKDFKEMIGMMEQLYASLKRIYSRKLIKKIFGQDTVSFEYLAHE